AWAASGAASSAAAVSTRSFCMSVSSTCVEQAVSMFLGAGHGHHPGRDEPAVGDQVGREVLVDRGGVAADRIGELCGDEVRRGIADCEVGAALGDRIDGGAEIG